MKTSNPLAALAADKTQGRLWKWFRVLLMLLGALELVKIAAAIAVHFLGNA